MTNDLSEIEIEHQCYCADHGYFCRYLDKASGMCIATTCRHAQELLQQVEIEKQAKANQELKDGYFAIQDELYERAIAELEQYGATTVDLDIKEEDLDDIRRSWQNVHQSEEKDRRCERNVADIASDNRRGKK